MSNPNFNNLAYAVNSPSINVFPIPIIAKRIPTSNDISYQYGQLWIVPSTNVVYVLTSVLAGVANWQLLESSGMGGSFTTLTSTGQFNLDTTAVGANTLGNLTGATSLGISVGTGGFTLTGVAGSVVTIGTGITTGSFLIGGALTTGSVTIGSGASSSAINIEAGSGNINLTGATVSNSTITGTTIYASGDAGGVALENALTNVSVPVAGGTGAFTITSATTAGAAVNAGFLKFYVGTTPVFVPYYTTTA